MQFGSTIAKIGKDYRIKLLPVEKNFFEQLMTQLGGEAKIKFMQMELGELYPVLSQIKKLQRMEGIQARMPFDFILN